MKFVLLSLISIPVIVLLAIIDMFSPQGGNYLDDYMKKLNEL